MAFFPRTLFGSVPMHATAGLELGGVVDGGRNGGGNTNQVISIRLVVASGVPPNQAQSSLFLREKRKSWVGDHAMD